MNLSTPFLGIVAYVEAREGNESRNNAVKYILRRMGAKFERNITKKVNVVIFQDGRLSTFRNAKKRRIPLVSIYWILECKRAEKLLPMELYPCIGIEKYEAARPNQRFRRPRNFIDDVDLDHENTERNQKMGRKDDKALVKKQSQNQISHREKKNNVKLYKDPNMRGFNEILHKSDFHHMSPGCSYMPRKSVTGSQLRDINQPISKITSKELRIGSDNENEGQAKANKSSKSNTSDESDSSFELSFPKCAMPLRNSAPAIMISSRKRKVQANRKNNSKVANSKENHDNHQRNAEDNFNGNKELAQRLDNLQSSIPTKGEKSSRKLLPTRQSILIDSCLDNTGASKKRKELPNKRTGVGQVLRLKNGTLDDDTTPKRGSSVLFVSPKVKKPIMIPSRKRNVRAYRKNNIKIGKDKENQPNIGANFNRNKELAQRLVDLQNNISTKGEKRRRKVLANAQSILIDSCVGNTGAAKKRIELQNEQTSARQRLWLRNGTVDDDTTPTPKRGSSALFVSPKVKKPRVRSLSTIVFTGFTQRMLETAKVTVKCLGRFRLESQVTDRTTHVVASLHRRTMNLLKGILRGCWIIKYQWVVDSKNAGKWLYEEPYELTEFSPMVKECRTERLVFRQDYSLDLFRDVGPIYMSPNTRQPSKDLTELLRLAGGTVMSSARNCKLVIGGQVRYGETITRLDENWILDSITNNNIQIHRSHLLKPPLRKS